MAKYKSQKIGEIHRISKKKSNVGDIFAGIIGFGVIVILMASCAG